MGRLGDGVSGSIFLYVSTLSKLAIFLYEASSQGAELPECGHIDVDALKTAPNL